MKPAGAERDDALAHELDAIRAVLARRLPDLSVRSLVRLGAGQENVAYEVNGDLIVRRSREHDPEVRRDLTTREAALLATVAEHATLPIPVVIFADPESGILAYRKLPGRPLMGVRDPDPERLAPALGAFASRLHQIPVERMRRLAPMDAQPLDGWRDDAERDYREIAEHLPAPTRRLVEEFLGRPLPPEPRRLTFCHNDLGAEHILVDDAAHHVTGIIDWTDAAIADPAYDLALIYRDLGPEALDLMLARHEGVWDDADRERVRFYARCSLLEDVAYGVQSGAARYAEAGLAHLSRTFGTSDE